MSYELSVLIPARNEMFLGRTVEDVLEHSSDRTEIIVVLDGYWPEEGLAQHPRVTVIHHEESIGQRAATNEAARISRAKHIMKLDAHCSMDKNFDAKLIEAASELGDDVTQVPAQYNLHAYDWQCDKCRHRRYQGPTPTKCAKCGSEKHHREMVWKPRESRLTTAWRFDRDLKFQYWGEFKHRPEGQKEISETLSLLGACWLMSRARYWELDGLDENHGSWGQMGTEIACKSWLSGGRLVCNKRTWFAHMFRTQGGDFSFPYPISGSEVNRARKYSRELWMGNRWPKQKHSLEWLIEKFAPVPGWENGGRAVATVPGGGPRSREAGLRPALTASIQKGIVYYSDGHAPEHILKAARERLEKIAAERDMPIISVTLKPVDFGANAVLPLERGYLTMFKQILLGLKLINADVVFFCEHDVLYHESHFDFTPTNGRVYYNENVWKVRADDGHALFYHTKQTSGLCAYRDVLLEHYTKRVELVERNGFTRRMGFEPGSHGRAERVDDLKSESWMSPIPNIDIRHGKNLTPSRWRQEQFRNKRSCQGWKESDEVPGWGRTKGRFNEILRGE